MDPSAFEDSVEVHTPVPLRLYGRQPTRKNIWQINFSDIGDSMQIQMNSVHIDISVCNDRDGELTHLLTALSVARLKKHPQLPAKRSRQARSSNNRHRHQAVE